MVLLSELHKRRIGDGECMRRIQPIRRGLRVLLDSRGRIDRQHLEGVDRNQHRMIRTYPRVDLVSTVPFAEVVHHQALVNGVHHHKVVFDPR